MATRLFKLTTNKLRYHAINYYVVLTQLTGKTTSYDYADYTVLLHYYNTEISHYVHYPVMIQTIEKYCLSTSIMQFQFTTMGFQNTLITLFLHKSLKSIFCDYAHYAFLVHYY